MKTLNNEQIGNIAVIKFLIGIIIAFILTF
jgi:hypothetical protein